MRTLLIGLALLLAGFGAARAADGGTESTVAAVLLVAIAVALIPIALRTRTR